MDWETLAARLGLALLGGLIIGWDRQKAGKPAGMRTHMLVSLGSCVFVLVPLALTSGSEAMTRSIQGVTAGIGFLGGGEIVRRGADDREKVKGLTSAAAVWLTARGFTAQVKKRLLRCKAPAGGQLGRRVAQVAQLAAVEGVVTATGAPTMV